MDNYVHIRQFGGGKNTTSNTRSACLSVGPHAEEKIQRVSSLCAGFVLPRCLIPCEQVVEEPGD